MLRKSLCIYAVTALISMGTYLSAENDVAEEQSQLVFNDVAEEQSQLVFNDVAEEQSQLVFADEQTVEAEQPELFACSCQDYELEEQLFQQEAVTEESYFASLDDSEDEISPEQA